MEDDAVAGRPLLLALDPGTRWLGWAFADLADGAPVECGRADISEKAAPSLTYEDRLTGALNALRWRGVGHGRVLVIYVEGAGGGPNPKNTLMIAECAGATIQECARVWPRCPVERLAPAEWKKIAGIKGNADKAAVAERAAALGWRFDHKADDASDAALIATAGVIRNHEILARAEAAEADREATDGNME